MACSLQKTAAEIHSCQSDKSLKARGKGKQTEESVCQNLSQLIKKLL